MCKIKMIGAEISKVNVYPGERLYVKCTFQALADNPIDCEVQLFADFCFGHMFIDKKEERYYRMTASMYPMPAHWKKGEIWSFSIVWNVPKEIWGGAYAIFVGMIDDDTCPISFFVGEKIYKRYYISDVNVAFNGVAKKYMESHSSGGKFCYGAGNISPDAYKHNFDAVIAVRNIKTDKEEKMFTTLKSGEKFSDIHVSFILKKDEKSFFIDNITEDSGYELLYIKIPLMFTHENSEMITLYGEGRIVSPKSYPWGYEQSYWIRNTAILSNEKDSILVETPFLDEKLHHSVCELDGSRFCALGVTFTYRVRAYGNLESIKVVNIPTVQVRKVPGKWQNCLPFLRNGITKKTNMYDYSLFYYNNLCRGPESDAQTFDEALEKIKKIHRLTGGIRQYMLLCGWQHEGHDTGGVV